MTERRYTLLWVLVCSMAFFSCRQAEMSSDSGQQWRNLSDTARYVGMQACRGCHFKIYESYVGTAMGRSFSQATTQKTAARFDTTAIVYDSLADFFYRPYFRNDSMFIEEFRIAGKDTLYRRTEYVSYIIGSGSHTNSHLVLFNGYLYQAPITYYTQRGRWDLAPGFEGGYNSRFSRIIGFECITCHNALPQFVAGSENRYAHIPLGIDCERCHGPGSIHVREKLAGILVDTSQQPDYSIVNPRRLSKSLQMQICQRCHLQGITVLNKGKNFDQFVPGMSLGEVFHVFLPEFEGKHHNFLMASHVERLLRSRCYQHSEMTCITCHNPHVSLKEISHDTYNKICSTCHVNEEEGKKAKGIAGGCTLKNSKNPIDNDCITCHMPRSGSIDIPHVSITDHYIRKTDLQSSYMLSEDEVKKIKKFIQLKCYTHEHPDALLKARAFLAYYEKFSSDPVFLDSVLYYLRQSHDSTTALSEWIHYYYLRGDYGTLTHWAKLAKNVRWDEPWTCYRIGEALYQLGKYKEAISWLEKATHLSPYQLDFLNKTASLHFRLGNIIRAKEIYEEIVCLQPKYKEAWSNLGYIMIIEKNHAAALRFLNKALALDPDYEAALLNKAVFYFQTNDKRSCKMLLQQILHKNPYHAEAKQLMRLLQ